MIRGESIVSERVRTLHPAGKQGVNIDKEKYDQVKRAILASIEARGQIPFRELTAAVESNLDEPFDGSIGWYTTTVKLDLEARGMIERVPKKSPQVLRLGQGF
jgi:hypothetical protein